MLGQHQHQHQHQQPATTATAQPTMTTSLDSTAAREPTIVNGEHAHGTQDAMAPTRGKGGLGGHEKTTFGGWLRLWGVDLITMAAMGAVGLGIYEAGPAPSRNFPVYFSNGEVVYPEYAYPLRKNIIPIYAAALLAFFVPFVFFVIMQIRRRSFHDLTATTMGLLMSLITAAVFQVFLKWLIGGFRPHFLAVCKPVITPELTGTGTGFGGIMFDRSVCTGDEHEINDALESFPSGHSTAAGAGFVYLSLYLNAMLKIFSDNHPAYWKHVLFFAPLLGAALIAGSLTIDKYHHAHDVIGGLLIGTLCAFGSFRMVFASIWDFRFNHMLLPRQQSLFIRHPKASAPGRFDYSLGSSAASGLNEKAGAHGHHGHGNGVAGVNAPFTRDGGWGTISFQQGAPGDAAYGSGSHGTLGEQRGAGFV